MKMVGYLCLIFEIIMAVRYCFQNSQWQILTLWILSIPLQFWVVSKAFDNDKGDRS